MLQIKRYNKDPLGQRLNSCRGRPYFASAPPLHPSQRCKSRAGRCRMSHQSLTIFHCPSWSVSQLKLGRCERYSPSHRKVRLGDNSLQSRAQCPAHPGGLAYRPSSPRQPVPSRSSPSSTSSTRTLLKSDHVSASRCCRPSPIQATLSSSRHSPTRGSFLLLDGQYGGTSSLRLPPPTRGRPCVSG